MLILKDGAMDYYSESIFKRLPKFGMEKQGRGK
jgi:hypothetical protein